ncbi:hypothetical protein TNCV_4030381 [Trichonephila clavipes]|nr:hypothetical protein TNCV_4030381 [Trichonephila clavipes]
MKKLGNEGSDLEPEDEQPKAVEKPAEIPKQMPHLPINLKIKKSFRDQLKIIFQKYPNIKYKTTGEFFKIYASDCDVYHNLTHAFEVNSDLELCVCKPMKIVVKGLPVFTETDEIQTDFEEE